MTRRAFAAGGTAAAALLAGGAYARLTQLRQAGPALLASRVIGEDFPFQIIDPTGAVQTLSRPPRRVVSASLPGDETLPSLLGRERIVSVTFQADNHALSNVPGYYAPALHRNHVQVEELIALEPDLIILRDLSEASTVRLLIAAGVTIVRMAFYESFDGIEDNVRTLAKLLGVREAGEATVGQMRQTLAHVGKTVAAAEPPRTLWYDVITSNSAGAGTLNDETLTLGGGANVVREIGMTGYVRITSELAVSLMPDVMLLNSWPDGEAERTMLLKSPVWRDVPAVKTGRVHVVSSPLCTTGSPFRAKGVESVARMLHPERFTHDG